MKGNRLNPLIGHEAVVSSIRSRCRHATLLPHSPPLNLVGEKRCVTTLITAAEETNERGGGGRGGGSAFKLFLDLVSTPPLDMLPRLLRTRRYFP